MKYPIVEPANARSEKYRQYLEEILESGRCPFCVGGTTRFDQEILAENEGWWLTCTTVPIEGARMHFLIIPQRHVLSMQEINVSAFKQLQQIFALAKRMFGFEELVCYWREGNPMTTGASVTHIHLQCIIPESRVEVFIGTFKHGQFSELYPWEELPVTWPKTAPWHVEQIGKPTKERYHMRLLPSRSLGSLTEISEIEWLVLLSQLEKITLIYDGTVTYWAEGPIGKTGSSSELLVPYCIVPNGTVKLQFGR